MQRNIATYKLGEGQAKEIKQKMLNWTKQFSIFLFLDSNSYSSPYTGYECLLAAGCVESCGSSGEGDDSGHKDLLQELQRLYDARKDWIFGHICYDYKNVLEPKLSSAHAVNMGFPLLVFFIPETVCYINRGKTALTIESFGDTRLIYNAILNSELDDRNGDGAQLRFEQIVDKESYINTIASLRSHIMEGDCYEINFCTERFCKADIRPLQVFRSLNALSPAPFAAFYRLGEQYMMCASPERYLRKEGNKILSQPIKGTARRDPDINKDRQIKENLYHDIKERAENVMIVDLVRNDLAHCCVPGSVEVEELFGIYTFPQVHQMISTVSGRIREEVPFTDAIRYSFPMGSMTGAPKYKVMQLIEQYEKSLRELYSGTVGYITPGGDFDFNVVIRSLFYNSTTGYLSYQTGGAITYDSDAEREWEEMRLKAWALERIFTQEK